MFVRNYKNVLKRELDIMFSRAIYLFASFVVIGFSYLFFLTFLGEGLPSELPIAVVDNDNSTISRRFIKELSSTQNTKIKIVAHDFYEARREMQKGNIYGIIVLPEGLYSNILSNRRPKVAFYTNNAFSLAGTLVYKDLSKMSVMASAAVQREFLKARGINEREIMNRIMPISIDSHQIGNPWASYNVYLVNILIPGILQLMILLMTVFPIGIELKNQTSREWLDTAGGSIAIALAGKLTPYTLIFSVLGVAGNVLLYKIIHFPMNGSFLLLSIGTLLYVVAYQAVGIFAIGTLPVLRDAISFTAIFGTLGFSFAGFTFPVEAMPRLIQGIANLFPIRHYYLLYVKEALLGAGFSYTFQHYTALMIFYIAPLVILYRLKNALIHQNYPLK